MLCTPLYHYERGVTSQPGFIMCVLVAACFYPMFPVYKPFRFIKTKKGSYGCHRFLCTFSIYCSRSLSISPAVHSRHGRALSGKNQELSVVRQNLLQTVRTLFLLLIRTLL